MSMAAVQGPARAPRILVADDDPAVGLLLVRYLSTQGMRVDTACSAAQVRAAFALAPPDAVLLDLGLPDADGLDLMRELRQGWDGAIVVVTGRGEAVERVVGLELGADDYVTKPFDLRELLARLRSVLRRTRRAAGAASAQPGAVIDIAGLRIDVAAREVHRADGSDVELTRGEFDLLVAFAERAQRVLSRDELMDVLHGRDAGPFDRSIDVRIGRLRRKLEADPGHPCLIKSVRGAGYMLAAPARRP